MRTSHVKYLLVGGGVAASGAIASIRDRDGSGSLLMVTQEINRPYHRPLLHDAYLRGQLRHDQLFAEDASWFSSHRVDLRTGRRAAQLDCARQAITLDDGERVQFDHLLLATGAGPRPLAVPGANFSNVHSLRTIQDADRLKQSIDAARKNHAPGHAVVVGGGLLGVEFAAAMAQQGLRVHLLTPHAHPWSRFAGEMAGRYLQASLEARGVTVRTGTRVEAMAGDGRAQRVMLADGDPIPCDFACVCIGIVPHRELLRGTPIAAERAILVDERCRSSVPNIFAAGDCAAIFDSRFGKHRVLDHAASSAELGRIAGANMAGDPTVRYQSLSTFETQVFDLRAQVWGAATLIARRVTRTSAGPAEGQRTIVEVGVAADGRICHALAVNLSLEEGQAISSLVDRRVAIASVEEQVKDPSVSWSSVAAISG